MSSVNKVILIGNLGKDPEVRYINETTPVANFTLATTESYKDKNGNRQDITEWHNIVVWRGLAEVAEKYLKKGKQIYVEGRLRTRSWDDKEGNKRYTTEIVADNFVMLGKKEGDGTEGQNSYQSQALTKQEHVGEQAPAHDQIPIDDDLPF
jgi:single-strand DNA-binding protein